MRQKNQRHSHTQKYHKDTRMEAIIIHRGLGQTHKSPVFVASVSKSFYYPC